MQLTWIALVSLGAAQEVIPKDGFLAHQITVTKARPTFVERYGLEAVMKENNPLLEKKTFNRVFEELFPNDDPSDAKGGEDSRQEVIDAQKDAMKWSKVVRYDPSAADASQYVVSSSDEETSSTPDSDHESTGVVEVDERNDRNEMTNEVTNENKGRDENSFASQSLVGQFRRPEDYLGGAAAVAEAGQPSGEKATGFSLSSIVSNVSHTNSAQTALGASGYSEGQKMTHNAMDSQLDAPLIGGKEKQEDATEQLNAVAIIRAMRPTKRVFEEEGHLFVRPNCTEADLMASWKEMRKGSVYQFKKKHLDLLRRKRKVVAI